MLRIISGTARGRRFEAPEGRDTRPTLDRVRENLFNMLQGQVAGARVLDPFAGSGTTIVACEQLGRRAYCMELDGHYAAVIVRRWESLTGRKAVQI